MGAQEASMKVEKAKKELEDISAILSTVQDPEPGLLQALQRRVEAAERTYKAAELDERLNEFEAARKRQAEQMRDLQRELEYVRGENENIAQIRSTAHILHFKWRCLPESSGTIICTCTYNYINM